MRRHQTTRRPRRPRKRRARLRRMREPAGHPLVVARDGQMPCGRTLRPTTRGRTSPPCSTARSRARALLRWDWGGERQRAVSERDRADVSSARADASEDRRTVSKRAKKRALGKGSDGWDADGRAPLEARAAGARPPRATTVAWGLVATANMVRSCRCGRRTRSQSLLLCAKSR